MCVVFGWAMGESVPDKTRGVGPPRQGGPWNFRSCSEAPGKASERSWAGSEAMRPAGTGTSRINKTEIRGGETRPEINSRSAVPAPPSLPAPTGTAANRGVSAGCRMLRVHPRIAKGPALLEQTC